MTVTVIALLSIREENAAALAAYLDCAMPLLDRVGARIVHRFEITEAVVGRRPAKTVMIVEYPDRAAVDAVFGSEAYQRIIPFRDLAFADYHITIAGN